MSSSSAPVPVLTYFNVPGRGEIARLLFTIGKVDFEVGSGCSASEAALLM